jgi:hypothetical protein
MFLRLLSRRILAGKTELRNNQETVPFILLRIAVINSILLTAQFINLITSKLGLETWTTRGPQADRVRFIAKIPQRTMNYFLQKSDAQMSATDLNNPKRNDSSLS